ncbi:hypothetical protein LWP59_24205 [Amycolatopsis acidiphila]|nr:hypothetical protein [Amycolatopsis acidiphila]UIJ57252.1 hypothetical protein LWP59_24205 [Amycolatopsis acidiphila]GHG52395.1 hypothetical protein GCM10017788_00400 [Amycolatopsis acidiphila]
MSSARPLTGASSTVTRRRAPSSASRRMPPADIVACWMITEPGRAVRSSPPSPVMISKTCSSENGHSASTSADAASSATEAAGAAPSAVNRSRTSAFRAKRRTATPAASSRSTIGPPIEPAPTKPMSGAA